MDAEIDHRIRNVWPDAPMVARVEVHTERVHSRADLQNRLEGKRGDGWLCTTSDQPGRWDGTWPALPILSAELATNASTSIHVRHVDGTWLVTTITEGPGEPCLAYDVSYLGSLEGLSARSLSYRVFWKPSDVSAEGVGVLRPFVARFVGWDRETA